PATAGHTLYLHDALPISALTAEAHPIPGIDPGNATAQQGVPGPASDRLPHFRADQLPSAGAAIQCEYLLPRHSARLALRALAGLDRKSTRLNSSHAKPSY